MVVVNDDTSADSFLYTRIACGYNLADILSANPQPKT